MVLSRASNPAKAIAGISIVSYFEDSVVAPKINQHGAGTGEFLDHFSCSGLVQRTNKAR